MNKSKFLNFSITVLFGIFIVAGIVWGSSYGKDARIDPGNELCINLECKKSWPIAARATGEVVGTEVDWAKIEVGGKWYAIKLSHLGSITRVYTNTVMENGYFLSTYDDFSRGATDTCQKLGYNSSTGAYQCGTLTTNGRSRCSPSNLNYRHNGGWGIFNVSSYDSESGLYVCSSGNGQNWCTGDQYLRWVDCIK